MSRMMMSFMDSWGLWEAIPRARRVGLERPLVQANPLPHRGGEGGRGARGLQKSSVQADPWPHGVRDVDRGEGHGASLAFKASLSVPKEGFGFLG